MLRGALRHSIAIYRPSGYDAGNEVTAWGLLANVRASVRVLEVTESVGRDLQGVEHVVFNVPYSRAFELDYIDTFIVHRGREYDVMGVENVRYLDKVLKIAAKRSDLASRVL